MAGRALQLLPRDGHHRTFTASSITLKRRGRRKTSNNDGSADEDPFAILEEAARRTTTPQVIDPATTFRPKPLPNPTMQQDEEHFPTLGKMASKKAQGKQAARVPSKTKKQIDDEEAAAFLEEATKRVTSQRAPAQTIAPVEAQKNLQRAPQSGVNVRHGVVASIPFRTPSQIREGQPTVFEDEASSVTRLQMSEQSKVPAQTHRISSQGHQAQEEEENEKAAFVEEIRKHVNYKKMSDLLTASVQTPQLLTPALWNRKKTGEEKATSRANHGGLSELRGSSAKSPKGMAGPKQTTREALSRKGDSSAKLGAQNAAGSSKATVAADGKAFPSHLTNNRSGEELQKWYKEAVERVMSHERRSEMATSQRDPYSNLHQPAKRKMPHPREPWVFRTSRRTISTKASKSDPSGGEPQHTGKPLESPSCAGSGTKMVEPMVHEVAADNRLDAEAHSSSASLQKNTHLPSVFLEESNPSPVLIDSKRSSGVLSSLEREELSSLLSSLKARDTEKQYTKPKADVKAFSNSIPISPYQRVQTNEHPVKARARAEAKQRLLDNPWAVLLASPVRMCQATGVRLPKKIMVGWSYVRSPKDDQIYLMPEELANLSQLGAEGRNNSLSNKFSGEGRHQRTLGSDPTVPADVTKSTVTNVSAPSTWSGNGLDEKGQGHGSENSIVAQTTSESHKPNPTISPAKLHMRPSSILLRELSKRMRGTGERAIKTTPGTVNRLVPNRWREQARKFEKSAEARSPQVGFLTTQEMHKVQWHPNIENIMLNLLQSRVLKALEVTVMRNAHQTGIHRRIIPLPSVGSGTSEERSTMVTSPGIKQAVLLWLGNEESSRSTSPDSESNTRQSSHPPPAAPSTSASSILRFVPHNDDNKVVTSPSGDARGEPDHVFIPIWTHDSTAHATNQSDHTVQNPYAPSTISLELYNATNNHSPTDKPVTYSLPAFDLHALLGESSTIKLHTLSQSNQAIADAFGLNHQNEASGWVMVKGGYGVKGFKKLVQEVWRLWLFVGGRRLEENRDE
ncbi:hypothetical protein EPUS_04666 [Endocarpon pusillum Z07020]|uniref:Uncharacterized protein n=1 Tax=Endocarpon pusillum (strain Z07020 / HMAS-L-300199) TaxID=1263415 RepID=U1G999_ENDPU|nr:uncharacterized protein EPUS_04666 [Endocarpon pusillum Z07020]ERF68568.1 hypothetical protein EPUS_04666 [Endocarpon pusillum Z07020]